MSSAFASLFNSPPFVLGWHYTVLLAPIIVPIFALLVWFDIWIKYKQREYIQSQGSVLLEIRIPREMSKSPAAMEVVLSGIYEPVVGPLTDVYFTGKVRPWFSLEIASIEGNVKFFMWALPAWKRNIEARLYAQFPNIEIHEVADYTAGVHYDPSTMKMSSFQTSLVKHNVYPIKTYVDFGLDKLGDEDEEKIDPLTPLIEWMGSLGVGEQCWIQIMIQAHAKKGLEDATISIKKTWDKEVNNEIKKFIKESPVAELEEGKKPRMLDLTKVQQETIEAIQRSQGKLPYDAMIRAIYFAKIENYNSMATAGMIHSFRHFGSANLNGIKPVFSGIDYPWQDFQGRRKLEYQRNIFEAYKRRSTFNGPYKNWNARPYVLNTEELATLFHFPSSIVAATPTLQRIPSKKVEAPANLPV
jgi:hypothetical protein